MWSALKRSQRSKLTKGYAAYTIDSMDVCGYIVLSFNDWCKWSPYAREIIDADPMASPRIELNEYATR